MALFVCLLIIAPVFLCLVLLCVLPTSPSFGTSVRLCFAIGIFFLLNVLIIPAFFSLEKRGSYNPTDLTVSPSACVH